VFGYQARLRRGERRPRGVTSGLLASQIVERIKNGSRTNEKSGGADLYVETGQKTDQGSFSSLGLIVWTVSLEGKKGLEEYSGYSIPVTETLYVMDKLGTFPLIPGHG